MRTCIIAEKPSVARDIARVMGVTRKKDGYIENDKFTVTWAMGHLVTLAMPEAYGFAEYRKEDLPIIPKDFKLVVRQIRKGGDYVPDPSALRQLKVIEGCFRDCDRIIVATDAGREGELIFRYIYHYLGCSKPFDRLWISSLTDKSIMNGMSSLKRGCDYDHLYMSAKARSESDWLVGINASRALSIAKKGGYSLGRVQTPTLAMVCRRYRENTMFKSATYWKVSAGMSVEDKMEITAVGTRKYQDETNAHEALNRLKEAEQLKALRVEQKDCRVHPPLLFDLTSLQKSANSRYSFSADKTLSIAQRLYESKLATYPRTGSRYISKDVFEQVPSLLEKMGLAVPPVLNGHTVDDAKVTDHHAIIPTGESPDGLSSDEQKVYEMIVERFSTSFLEDSMERRMRVVFSDGEEEYEWKGRKILVPGWRNGKEECSEAEGENEPSDTVMSLPVILENEEYRLSSADLTSHQTKPKPLYTEATLLGAMEHADKEVEDAAGRKAISECGIGTPATRASIIETLIIRGYIIRNKRNLLPTEKGLSVYDAVKEKKIADVDMTAGWELELASIETGNKDAGEFHKGIQEYSRMICMELLQLTPDTRKYPVATCPKCGRDSVTLYPKVAKCSHEGCALTVFREVCGHVMTEGEILQLLEKGCTPLLKGLKGKNGTKFNAKLTMNDDFTTIFEFEKGKGKKK